MGNEYGGRDKRGGRKSIRCTRYQYVAAMLYNFHHNRRKSMRVVGRRALQFSRVCMSTWPITTQSDATCANTAVISTWTEGDAASAYTTRYYYIGPAYLIIDLIFNAQNLQDPTTSNLPISHVRQQCCVASAKYTSPFFFAIS